MKFIDTIDNFKTLYSNDVYKARINSFQDFLISVKGINDSSYATYLSNMNKNEIIQALDYFIENNEIKKESVAYHYISVVVKYFQYLVQCNIENSNLLKEIGLDNKNENSFYYTINQKIQSDARLDKIESKAPLDLEDVKLLIIEADDIINKALCNKENIFKGERKQGFYNLTAALCVKIMLFAGLKYESAKDIDKIGVDVKKNKMLINSFNLHLPDNLSEQIKEYIEIRNTINSKSSKLFIKSNGSELGRATDKISRLMQIIGRGDTTGIVKFTVIEMIKKGINQRFIMNLTSVGPEIYSYCQNIVDEERKITADRYLDSKIRGLELFDYL